MPWQIDRIGLAEACLDGIKASIVAGIDDLNTILGVSPAINLGIVIDDTFVNIGDPDTLPDQDIPTFWITLCGGGKSDGRDQHIEINASGPQYRVSAYHNIYCYLNPNVFPGIDVYAQAELRERFRARLQDWLTWRIFNNITGIEITLTSRQFAVSPKYDVLTRSMITDVSKGYVMKSFAGSDWVFMTHFMHEALLLGGR
jgi:hypothetical protein